MNKSTITKEQVKGDAVSFPALMREIKQNEGETHKSHREVRVAVIASSSIQHFCCVLSYVLRISGYEPVIFQSEYDGINMTLLQDNNELMSFNPEYVVILPYHLDIKAYPQINTSAAEYENLMDGVLKRQSLIWDNLNKLSNVHVFFCNYVIPYVDGLGSYGSNTKNSHTHYLHDINDRLLLTKPSFVTIIDLDAYASQVGKNNWFDYTSYFTTKVGFSLNYILPVVNKVVRLIDALNSHVKKCLVLDLDNTLWGDVVSDVGVQGVILDPNDAEGESYRFFQSYVKELKQRGVILAVCSKNDESIAKKVFTDNPNMILKLEDISCFIANWDDKATNIVRIAQELNISLDSLVFFDDNPVEQEIVRRNLPDVLVINVPEDSDKYVPILYESGAFDTVELTEEDLNRSSSYITKSLRDNLKSTVVDYDAYLQALDMEAEIRNVGKENIDRFVQLINKSNQFNLRTKRYTEKELDALVASPSCCLLAFYLKDKFAYYGNIACVILKKDSELNALFIDTLVMSCRVLKRGLEKVIFDRIVEEAERMSCLRIVGEYIPTERNTMVSTLLDDYGFSETSSSEGTKKYELVMKNYVSNKTCFITVK